PSPRFRVMRSLASGAVFLLPAVALVCTSARAEAQLVQYTGAVYYVSASGDDSRPGNDQALAWRTIARVNQQLLQPGDWVLFEAGSVFSGTIVLDPNESGTDDAPIRFS